MEPPTIKLKKKKKLNTTASVVDSKEKSGKKVPSLPKTLKQKKKKKKEKEMGAESCGPTTDSKKKLSSEGSLKDKLTKKKKKKRGVEKAGGEEQSLGNKIKNETDQSIKDIKKEEEPSDSKPKDKPLHYRMEPQPTEKSPKKQGRGSKSYTTPMRDTREEKNMEMESLVSQFLSDKALYAIRSETELKLKLESFKTSGLGEAGAALLLKRWRRREDRRLARIQERADQRSCFKCRGSGHLLADCPFASEESPHISGGGGICFKCGSTEHTSRNCPAKVKGYPFATCFVCGEVGHLVRDCSGNKKGIFPDGGACAICGNVNHLRNDCPTLDTKKKKKPDLVLSRLSKMASADDEEVNYALDEDTNSAPVKKKAKIVKF